MIPISEVGLGILASQTFLSGALGANCIEIADSHTVAQIQGVAGVLGYSARQGGLPLSVSALQLMLERKPTYWGVDAVARAMERLPAALFQKASDQAEQILKTQPILEDRETVRGSLLQCIERERQLRQSLATERRSEEHTSELQSLR